MNLTELPYLFEQLSKRAPKIHVYSDPAGQEKDLLSINVRRGFGWLDERDFRYGPLRCQEYCRGPLKREDDNDENLLYKLKCK